jgi:hypothetical protein
MKMPLKRMQRYWVASMMGALYMAVVTTLHSPLAMIMKRLLMNN